MTDADTLDPNAPPVDTREPTPNDLASQTGNPGHRGINPNEVASINPRLPVEDQSLPSINEPPGLVRGEPTKDTAPSPPPPVEATSGPPSINEPPGSEPAPPPAAPPAPTLPPLPSDHDLAAMTRAELDDLADNRGIDSYGAATKADVIEMLKA